MKRSQARRHLPSTQIPTHSLYARCETATAGQEIVPLEVNVLSPSAILAGIPPAVATLSVFTAQNKL